ncbi:hypothetical protein T492DRAFT_863594 [Pavlovales sp. CCMP2436]|nr:hypothetical protein T492DRAFT_863594 [Pavlovales sp. CCMP2436]
MGHLEVLSYAHEHGCAWDELTCANAATMGRLEVLRYAHDHGCAWDERTCSYAAAMGHLEMLRYAQEHDCPEDFEDKCDDVRLQRFVFGFLIIHHFYQLPNSA